MGSQGSLLCVGSKGYPIWSDTEDTEAQIAEKVAH